jgi:hypothetical protein
MVIMIYRMLAQDLLRSCLTLMSAALVQKPTSLMQCCGSGSGIGIGAFLTLGSGMGKKSRSGSGIRDEQPGSHFLELRNHVFGLKYLNPLMRIRDPGWKKFRSGIRGPGWKEVGSGIRDKHPGSATLH